MRWTFGSGFGPELGGKFARPLNTLRYALGEFCATADNNVAVDWNAVSHMGFHRLNVTPVLAQRILNPDGAPTKALRPSALPRAAKDPAAVVLGLDHPDTFPRQVEMIDLGHAAATIRENAVMEFVCGKTL